MDRRNLSLSGLTDEWQIGADQGDKKGETTRGIARCVCWIYKVHKDIGGIAMRGQINKGDEYSEETKSVDDQNEATTCQLTWNLWKISSDWLYWPFNLWKQLRAKSVYEDDHNKSCIHKQGSLPPRCIVAFVVKNEKSLDHCGAKENTSSAVCIPSNRWDPSWKKKSVLFQSTLWRGNTHLYTSSGTPSILVEKAWRRNGIVPQMLETWLGLAIITFPRKSNKW